MSPTPSTTTWELDDHSRGKHLVLERYLKAWLPILGTTQERIAFVDGFAGPGEYTGGERGSPIIALDAFEQHRANISAHVTFWFIEADPARASHLEQLVAPYRSRLGDRATVAVTTGTFDDNLRSTLTTPEGEPKWIIPSLVMVDPFGVSQTPWTVFREILRNPKSEIYISFMAEFVNRFKGTDEFERPLDELFGCPDWRASRTIQNFHDRKTFLFDLFKKALKRAGAVHVVHFELYRGAQLVYAIFFATGSDLACDRMKEAIWKADPAGGTSFVSGSEAALNLFTHDVSRFESEIVSGMSQRAPTEWLGIARMDSWARSDKTHYHSAQLRPALKNLERSGRIEVEPRSRKKRFTYPKGTLLRLVRES